MDAIAAGSDLAKGGSSGAKPSVLVSFEAVGKSFTTALGTVEAVRDITLDPDDAAIVTTIISLAHNLRLNVIAEGVETEAQLQYLRRHGCDEIQGYYFSRPVPAASLAELIRGGKSLAVLSADDLSRSNIAAAVRLA